MAEQVKAKRRPAADRREQILDAAVELFRAQGYAETSLREIADAVEIRKASLYYHYASKQDLLAAIHERFMDALDEQAAATAAADPVERIEARIHSLLAMMRDLRPYVEVFFRERHALAGEDWERVRARRRAYEKQLEADLRAGVEQGLLRADLDPVIASHGILGLCNWTYQWFDPEGRCSAEQIADQFAAIVFDGLRRRD